MTCNQLIENKEEIVYRGEKGKTIRRGEKWNRLTVIGYSHRNKNPFVKCICECGNKTTVDYYKLTSGHTMSCGCLQREKERDNGILANKASSASRWVRAKDVIGKPIGWWTIIGLLSVNKQIWYTVKCKCGTISSLSPAQVSNKSSKSCGCYLKTEEWKIIRKYLASKPIT